MTRKVIRAVIGLAFAVSMAVIVVALADPGNDVEAWAAVAAALAVIAAIISAWSAQRVLELQEDGLRPYAYPSIDVRSRYGLLLLRVTNAGGTTAHNIRLVWDKPLTNSDGKRVEFTPGDPGVDISVLLPKDSLATIIDGNVQFYAKFAGSEANYGGIIIFCDPSGREYRERFRLSLEQYAGTPVNDEEGLRTHYDLQQIPGEIKKISGELSRIRRTLEDAPPRLG